MMLKAGVMKINSIQRYLKAIPISLLPNIFNKWWAQRLLLKTPPVRIWSIQIAQILLKRSLTMSTWWLIHQMCYIATCLRQDLLLCYSQVTFQLQHCSRQEWKQIGRIIQTKSYCHIIIKIAKTILKINYRKKAYSSWLKIIMDYKWTVKNNPILIEKAASKSFSPKYKRIVRLNKT